jgi:hypothetical protein
MNPFLHEQGFKQQHFYYFGSTRLVHDFNIPHLCVSYLRLFTLQTILAAEFLH